MQYSRAFIFYKHTDLLPYFYSKCDGKNNLTDEEYAKQATRYAVKRNVRLIVLARYDGGKMICRIKCPINPMPIRGEFEASSVYDLFAFLEQMGWEHKETVNLHMFK